MNSAKKSKCTSNLTQIAHGIMLYTSDNDGQFPPDTDPAKAGQQQGSFWAATIWTYVGYAPKSLIYPENDLQGSIGADKNIFHCPVTKYYSKAQFKEICVPKSWPVGNRFSYAMNNTPSRVLFGDPNIPVHLGNIKNAGATALVMEMHESGGNQWSYHNAFGLLPHDGACNVLFYDGHIELILYKNIAAYKDTTDPTLAPFWSGN